jgi:hypothetical protein
MLAAPGRMPARMPAIAGLEARYGGRDAGLGTAGMRRGGHARPLEFVHFRSPEGERR